MSGELLVRQTAEPVGTGAATLKVHERIDAQPHTGHSVSGKWR